MAKRRPMKFGLRNLVVLRYAQNVCYVEVVPATKVDGLTFDLSAGTYTRNDSTFKIGERGYGVIGVYDRSKISQIAKMVSDATEAVRDHRGGGDD